MECLHTHRPVDQTASAPVTQSTLAGSRDEQSSANKYHGIQSVEDLVKVINETSDSPTCYQLRDLQLLAMAMLKKSEELGSEDEVREIRKLAGCKNLIVNGALVKSLYSKITDPLL